ncbi:unnamed protein product, partial [Scytosiphon promiscuus]
PTPPPPDISLFSPSALSPRSLSSYTLCVPRDMSYGVPHPSGEGELTLLNKISGFCKPGEMTALMGSSGAGKTTLLDVLAGRKTGGTTTGDIRINGHPKEQSTFTRIAGYVEQQDMHSPVVTVKEVMSSTENTILPAE